MVVYVSILNRTPVYQYPYKYLYKLFHFDFFHGFLPLHNTQKREQSWTVVERGNERLLLFALVVVVVIPR